MKRFIKRLLILAFFIYVLYFSGTKVYQGDIDMQVYWAFLFGLTITKAYDQVRLTFHI